MTDWTTFAVLLGGAAGALIGALCRSSPSGARIANIVRAVSPDTTTTVLLLVSAILLATGLNAGRYVLVVAMLSALAGGVITAWLFLVNISD